MKSNIYPYIYYHLLYPIFQARRAGRNELFVIFITNMPCKQGRSSRFNGFTPDLLLETQHGARQKTGPVLILVLNSIRLSGKWSSPVISNYPAVIFAKHLFPPLIISCFRLGVVFPACRMAFGELAAAAW